MVLTVMLNTSVGTACDMEEGQVPAVLSLNGIGLPSIAIIVHSTSPRSVLLSVFVSLSICCSYCQGGSSSLNLLYIFNDNDKNIF